MSQTHPTTSENRPRLPADVDWPALARTQLTLAADADRAAVRSSLLSEVHNDDGWLSPLRQDCYELLLRPTTTTARPVVPRGLLALRERELLVEIEAFADQFFTLSPLERSQQWHHLLAQCTDAPRAEYRLRQLEFGLSLSFPALNRPHEADAQNLLDVLCNLYVMRPRARASARATLRGKYGAESGRWKAAAKVLYAAWPAVVGLDRRLFNELRSGQVGTPASEPVIHRHVTVAPHPKPRVVSSPGSNWWIYPVAFVVLGILRGFSSNSDRSNSNYNYDRRYPYPDYNTYSPPNQYRDESYERLLKQMREERQQKSDSETFSNLPPEVQKILRGTSERNKSGSGSNPRTLPPKHNEQSPPASNPYLPNHLPSSVPPGSNDQAPWKVKSLPNPSLGTPDLRVN